MSPQVPNADTRRRSVTSTVPSEELATLDLVELRGYRHRLES